MSLDAKQTEGRTVTSLDDLLGYFRGAEQVTGGKLIGLEHEKLIYPTASPQPVPYPSGIEKVLTGFSRFGWKEFREAPELPVIAMTRGSTALSLEPGGQFELSGAPMKTAREAHDENVQHLSELHQVLAPLGLQAVALGYRPFDRLADMPWMPKTRYRAMRQTLGARGKLAHHMMLMTATGQVSLDWADEAECAAMVSAAARVTPLLIGLYANSPLVEGQPSGYRSFRSHVWSDVDPARCGFLPSMFDGSFSYRAYVEWALDAPLLFLRRRGEYLAPRLTFRQLLGDGFEGKPALYDDWVDHLSTLFPEVRIKRVLEVRSADCCDAAMTGALAALMRGLLYDPAARDELGELLPARTLEQHLRLHHQAQREGLAPFAAQARELVEIARRGLGRLGGNDGPLLDVLAERAASGRSPADDVLAAPRDPAGLYAACAIA
ncbi:MAG: glutamate--cysteine ligase [Archangiaceae bacterium]|nr:glutamate--cysteine ligase [Archangiaceae bacterium]